MINKLLLSGQMSLFVTGVQLEVGALCIPIQNGFTQAYVENRRIKVTGKAAKWKYCVCSSRFSIA